MSFFTDNMAESFIAFGILLMAIEVAILGFGTLFLFFIGASALVTGVLMSLGIINESWMTALAVIAISSTVLAVVLWKPLKRLQNQSEDPAKPHSDFVGLRFVTEQAISRSDAATYHYSGIQWKLKPSEPNAQIPANSEVEVVRLDVGVFYVRSV